MATATKTRTSSRQVDWMETLQTALTHPGAFGNTYNRFWKYSFLNQVLLWAQGVREPCASYKGWQRMGRQVQHGTDGALIVKPVTCRRKRKDESDEESTFTRFVLVRGAHPYSHTDGKELPAYELPTWSADAALAKLNVQRVEFRTLNANAQGYSTPDREVAVNPVAAYPFKTLMHELAHIVLGHVSDLEEYQRHRGVMEFQAEATALLLAKELEVGPEQFDEAESRAYIQHWLAGTTPAEAEIRAVFRAVDTILRAGRPDEATTER